MTASDDGKFDLVMTLLVRDEEDIIAANIEYHRAQGVDFFIVMDNLSIDRTASILQSYQESGLVHYIRQEDDDYDQGRWVTMMARMAFVRYGARWVINNDADEFWWPLEKDSLQEVLLGLPEQCNVVKAYRHNFVPLADATGAFFEHMIYREKDSRNPLGEPLPPKVCHRGRADVIVKQGNHAVGGFDTIGVTGGVIEIFHFPFRNLRQYEHKIIQGGQAYRRNKELQPEVGETWRRQYEHYRSHGHLPEQSMAEIRNSGQIADGLRRGRFVEDRRLIDYMTRLGSERLLTTG